MSKQRDIVPEVIQLVAECGVPVGMVLGGSVGEGAERADSDVDFFAIADASCQPVLHGFAVVAEKNGCKVLERKESAFPVHVACWTTGSLDEVLRNRPYTIYPLLRGRVVLDPGGIVERYRSRIRRYFAAHPSLEKAWVRQLQDLHRAKIGQLGRPAFPQWSDFNLHIEQVFPEEIAEPDAPADAVRPRR
jgi:hypothetical protein